VPHLEWMLGKRMQLGQGNADDLLGSFCFDYGIASFLSSKSKGHPKQECPLIVAVCLVLSEFD
ncbi:MAG: hypothetical protein IJW77_06660, partial [Clostridia bacterium]|nr:hypothetical protein [Clostridia bacterium]